MIGARFEDNPKYCKIFANIRANTIQIDMFNWIKTFPLAQLIDLIFWPLHKTYLKKKM